MISFILGSLWTNGTKIIISTRMDHQGKILSLCISGVTVKIMEMLYADMLVNWKRMKNGKDGNQIIYLIVNVAFPPHNKGIVFE